MPQITAIILEMILLGILLNIPILVIILKKELLSIPFGVLSGAFTTLTIFIISPFLWIALVAFFLSSSFLSKWKMKEKKHIYQEFAKGSKRDTAQVLANSAAIIIFGILHLTTITFSINVTTENTLIFTMTPWLIAAFATIATHNADTWMTEIGIISKKKPRLITNLRKIVPKGTSGGVSLEGTLAGIFGASIIAGIFGITAALISDFSVTIIIILVITITFAGLIGGLMDSVEGATIQKIYYCEKCKKETETNPHKCGEKTRYYRGYKMFTNDFVNFNSALTSGIIAFVMVKIIILLLI
ncbi:MAG: DUF92 domain-containing protein [Candidatus Hodarchaeales archaeon]